ncbi:MAG: hypothetical protein ACOC22_03115 [bacterium]
MELNIKQLGTQAIESTTGSKNMRMSADAQSMVFQLFTKNVYSNPIGTIVREIASNCFDSHIEAGVNAPVIIKKSFDLETNTHYISFIDFGVGMSPDRVENIYGVYFESTKRKNNDQIGGFGIGGKTPLAYKRQNGLGEGEYDNSFYVITNYEGRKYYYCIYEGPESPVYSMLHDEETADRNGTEIRIPVLEKDIRTFKKEMVRQLYYFENIIFEGFDGDDDYTSDDEILRNDYQIIQGKNFLFRGNDYSNVMHVCLGRVAYPIDYSVLGVSLHDYNIPVALKLNVGDIGVTVSREQLDYSEKTIKVLKDKLELAKQELIKMINVQYTNIVSLEDYLSKIYRQRLSLTFENGHKIYLDNVINNNDIDLPNFKYKDLKYPLDNELFNLLFYYKPYGEKVGSRRYFGRQFIGGYESIKSHSNKLYYVNDLFNRVVKKQSYLKSQCGTYYIIEKRKFDFDSPIFDWYKISSVFGVSTRDLKHDPELQKKYKKLIADLQKDYFEIVQKHAKNYDDVEVPEDFVFGRRKGSITEDMKNTTIPMNFVGGYGRDRVTFDKLFNSNIPIFYGTKDDLYLINSAVRVYKFLFGESTVVRSFNFNQFVSSHGKGKIIFCTVSKSNLKYFKEIKKAYPIKDFYWKMLYRKHDKIIEALQFSTMYGTIAQSLNDFYRNFDFNLIGQNDFAKKVETYKAITSSFNKDMIAYINHYKSDISRFMNVSDIELSDNAKKYTSICEEILNVQEKNEDVLKYIQLPYPYTDLSDTLVEILKKVLVFK